MISIYTIIYILQYLQSPSFEAEQTLSDRFNDGGVVMRSSRHFFGTEPGWFRIVFAIEKETLKTGYYREVSKIKRELEPLKRGFEKHT